MITVLLLRSLLYSLEGTVRLLIVQVLSKVNGPFNEFTVQSVTPPVRAPHYGVVAKQMSATIASGAIRIIPASHSLRNSRQGALVRLVYYRKP